MGIWTCPTCGLKGDYGYIKDEDNSCPLCCFPEPIPQDKVDIFKAFATIFEGEKLYEWWYTALWDNLLYDTIRYTSRKTVKMLFEHEIKP